MSCLSVLGPAVSLQVRDVLQRFCDKKKQTTANKQSFQMLKKKPDPTPSQSQQCKKRKFKDIDLGDDKKSVEVTNPLQLIAN